MFAFSLFTQSADAFSPFIFVYLLCTVVVMAAFIFQIDLVTEFRAYDFIHSLTNQIKYFQQFQHINVGLLLIVGALVSDTLPPFLFCFFGKMATDCYGKLANSFYEANWYELPVELQKYFVVMIQVSQQPIYYHGFNVILDLETFSKVQFGQDFE